MLRRVRMMREEARKTAEALPEMATAQMLTFGNLVLDIGRREVRLNEQVLAFKPKEYELLLFLAQHRGQVLTREFILERLWGWNFIGDSRTVDVHIRWLREKIEANPAIPSRIITVRGAGYRFDG